jgi:SPP1 family holin
MKNETIKAFIRLLVAAILAFNTVLTAKGLNPIPFDESAFSDVALQIATGLSVLWIWWRDNNVTAKARARKELSNKLKTGEVATVTVPKVEDDEMGDE